MAGKTVTLVMNGDVPLETFTEGVVQFQKLMRALSREIGHGSAIRWTLSDLEFGSADMSFVGEAEAPELLTKKSLHSRVQVSADAKSEARSRAVQ